MHLIASTARPGSPPASTTPTVQPNPGERLAPPPVPPAGVMGDAYARALERERSAPSDHGLPQAPRELRDRPVAVGGKPVPPASEAAADVKAASRKRPRDEADALDPPACVKPEVWKTAKSAAVFMSAVADARAAQEVNQGAILDGAIQCGRKGTESGSRFLRNLPATLDMRIDAVGEALLPQRVRDLLAAGSCSDGELAGALHTVRRLSAHGRNGNWPLTDLVRVLLGAELGKNQRRILAGAIVKLIFNCPDRQAESRQAQNQAKLGLAHWTRLEQAIHSVVRRALAGETNERETSNALTNLYVNAWEA